MTPTTPYGPTPSIPPLPPGAPNWPTCGTLVQQVRRRLPRAVWILLAVAAVWAAGLVVAALAIPMYGGTEVGSDNGVAFTRTLPARTLIGENGLHALAVVCIPLVTVAIVAGALVWRRHRRAGPLAGAGPLAWACAGVAVLLSLAGMLTIGPFLLPVGGLLCTACGLASTP